MIVTYVDRSRKKLNISSSVTNYVLPDAGYIHIKDIKSANVYINGNAYDVTDDKSFTIQVEQDNIDIEVDGVSFRIIVLCQSYRDETKFDYNIFGKSFYNNLIDGVMGEYELFNAIEEDLDDLKISLCTFNRKFDSITKDLDVNMVLKYVEKLPHIFQKPKQHLKQINEVRPASVATRIGQESISHLASHSEHWKGIKVNGLVPERLLARTLEDDYGIYENIAVKTLVDKLYKEMKALSEENIDCHMQIDFDDGHTISNESKDYYHARNILLKGMNDDEVFEQQLLLEEQKEIIDQILFKLGKCKSSTLYRNLKKAKPITGKLKNTNIFMMDKYYKNAYNLSEMMQKRQEVNIYDTVHDVKDEYAIFCKVLFLFALKYYNFELADKDQDVFEKNRFVNMEYRFIDWRLSIKDIHVSLIDVDAFEAEVFIDKPVEVDLNEISVSENAIKGNPEVQIKNNKLVLGTILTQSQQDDLVKDIKRTWPQNKQKIWSSTLKANIYAAYSNYKPSSKKVLFVPWKYMMPDNSIELEVLISELIKRVDTKNYQKVYFLIPSRPNELTHVSDDKVLNQLMSYGIADVENGLENSLYGFIPISMADMNSYRRYTKIILKMMIDVDEKRNHCPLCGNPTHRGSGGSSNVVVCHNCGYSIIDTICSNDRCKKAYAFSRYQLPKVTSTNLENVGFRVIERENRLGFKNITYAKIENNQIYPICPYCGK